MKITEKEYLEMAKKNQLEDYYLAIYLGPYKEVVEVLNSYIEKKMPV